MQARWAWALGAAVVAGVVAAGVVAAIDDGPKPAVAQETTTGSITGEVVDAQGAPVPGVTITVTSSQGAKTFVTDGNTTPSIVARVA